MYFKIKSKILFRKYEEYGYITDNTMFGYRMLNDNSYTPGEEYVSASGAVMLSMLSKTPKDIDGVVKELLNIFQGVEYEELKQDTIDFFTQLVNEGFLCCGDSFEECNINDIDVVVDSEVVSSSLNMIREDCSKNIINPNDFLRSIHIEISNECNERCIHCYIPHELKNHVIDSELFYQIVEEGRSLNILNVTISGGEPLIHKDFLAFIERCRELDLSVNVLTNLTLLTDDMILIMKKNPLLSVQTSLYSMDPEIHDFITKKKGSFEKTKENLLKLCAAGIPVQISCPVMKQNIESYKDVIEWGRKHNIPVGTDFVIFAEYDHSNANLVNRLSFDELRTIYDDELTEEYSKSLIKAVREKKNLGSNAPVCSVCRYYICVTAEGKAFPCVGWQTKIIGDLKRQTIKEIWENSKEVQDLRNIKLERFPKCTDCRDRGFCTICMMNNSNENQDGDPFRVTDFHCKVASMVHSKVDAVLGLDQ